MNRPTTEATLLQRGLEGRTLRDQPRFTSLQLSAREQGGGVVSLPNDARPPGNARKLALLCVPSRGPVNAALRWQNGYAGQETETGLPSEDKHDALAAHLLRLVWGPR